ncbi:MAG: DNA-binding protein [Clostridiales bacterium]|nr:DNA-binding protein [Clostridiales bacterium]
MVMQIQELNSYTKLFDAYGKLLSNKQYEVMDKFLNMDISASEMAELENGSRQAIHDALTKAKKQLVEFEEKCHFVENNELLRKKLIELKTHLDSKEQAEELDSIISNL